MTQIKKGTGHQNVIPYIRVTDARKFIGWTEEIFDAVQTEMVLREDGEVRHAQIMIGDATMMLGEASEEWPIDNGTFYIYVADTDALYKNALEKGAESIFPPYDEDYGSRGAGIKDPFGNTWWLSELI